VAANLHKIGTPLKWQPGLYLATEYLQPANLQSNHSMAYTFFPSGDLSDGRFSCYLKTGLAHFNLAIWAFGQKKSESDRLWLQTNQKFILERLLLSN